MSTKEIKELSTVLARRKRLTSAIFFLAICAGTALTVPQVSAATLTPSASGTLDSPASPQLPGGICLQSSGECLDSPAPSTQLQVDNGVAQAILIRGYVTNTSTEHWPFSDGSGWNARYVNSPVYEIYPNGGSPCLRTDNVIDGGQAIAVYRASGAACNSPYAQVALWVRRGTWLVNVGQTNPDNSAGYPQILNTGCTGHGCKVWVTPANKVAAGGLDWNFG